MGRQQQFDAVIRLKDQASAQLSRLEQNLKNHEKAWSRAGSHIQKTFNSVKSAGETLTTRLTLPLSAVGAASFSFAADLEDAFGASEQIYGDQAKTVQQWAAGLPAYYGIAEKEAMTYANTMGAMFKNIGGLSEKEAAKQTSKLIELAGDASAMFGGTTEDAMYAFQAALKGNNTMLDNYGMGVNDATIKAKALEMGLESAGGELSLADKQAATVALIMEQMADAEGQAARESEGASGAMKAFKTSIVNLGTSIGETLLPMITPIINKANEFMKKFDNLSDRTKKTIVIVGMVVAAIGPLLMIIGSIGIAVGGAITSFAMLGTVFSMLAAAISPIGILIGVVFAAAVAAGYYLCKHWDEVKAKAAAITEAIKTSWSNFVEGVQERFNACKESLVANANAVKEGVGKAFTALKKTIKNALLGPLNKGIELMNTLANSKVGRALTDGKTLKIQKVGSRSSKSRGGKSHKIGKNADGTSYWSGGLTTINERGGELIDLQRGARIYPHDKSVRMAYEDGEKNAGAQQNTIHVSFDGAVFHVREEADVDKIGRQIVDRMKQASMNRVPGKVIGNAR